MISSLDQADQVGEMPRLRAVYQLLDIKNALDHLAVHDEFYEGKLVTELTDRGHAT